MEKLQLSKPAATSNLELVRRDVLVENQLHLNCMDWDVEKNIPPKTKQNKTHMYHSIYNIPLSLSYFSSYVPDCSFLVSFIGFTFKCLANSELCYESSFSSLFLPVD